MNEELKKAIRENVCKYFFRPEEKEECKLETDHDCLSCARDFIRGWEARGISDCK